MKESMRTARTIARSLLLLVALFAPRTEAAPLHPVLAKAAVYADSNALGQARGIVDAVVAGQAPTAEAVTALATFFSSQRLYEEGAAAMRVLAPLCTNDVLIAVRREEGRALVRSGRIAEGLALLEAIPLTDAIRSEIASAQAIQKAMAGAMLTETIGLRETLDACSRSATPGPAALKLLRSQGDQIYLRDDGSGVDACEFIRQEAAKWPQAAAFQAALEADAAERVAALPEGHMRKFGEYWRVYQGTRPARQAAEKLADRLLDDGRADVAMTWYGRLLPFDGSARLVARYAYARSLTSAPGSLDEWMKSLSAAVRETTVNPGTKALPLGEFVAGLPVKPPEPAAPPFPSGLKPTPAWKAPVFPSEGLCLYRSGYSAERGALDRPIVLPAVSGDAVFVNTGLSLRRYAPDNGSNVWTFGFLDERGWNRYSPGAPSFPLPVFGAVVRDDLVVCRHAERITNIGLLSACGLTALDAKTGALRWRTRDIPELAGWHVASEPCVDRGIVTLLLSGSSADGTLGSRGETILRAVAIEARTGVVLWSRILVIGTDEDLRGVDGKSYGLELPRPLPAARGVCFATHMGRLFMLDALTGAVLWMQPYARTLADALAPRGPVNPLLAAGGAIISAPYDSARIFALEAATGKPLWDEPAALDPYLGGVWKGRLVTFGRGLRLRDAKSGATLAAEPLTWKPSAPVGFVNGDRLWLADETEARLYDLTTLKETGAVAAGRRLLPAGGLALSCSPNIISAFRLGGAESTPVAPPGRTVRARAAPVGGPKRDVREPVGEVAPRLLWTVSIPGSFSLPDEDRGLALVYGLYTAKLIDTDGFGEPYWETLSASIIRRVVWTDETVVLVTDTDLTGLDLATGNERWRQPTPYPLGALYAQGDLFVVGVTNDTEVLRVNPKDGSIRWRCPMPGDQVARVVRESGGRLHVELRPARDPNAGWALRELGTDGKLGRELWKDSAGFWDLGTDRVYTSGGSTYYGWDLGKKTMTWKEPFKLPSGAWVASKRVIAPTPAGRPWWFLASQLLNAVLDPLTGEVLYYAAGATWNSDVLELSDYKVLTRMSLEPGKAPRKIWATSLDGDPLRGASWPESGAALRVITFKFNPPYTRRFLELDPATGKGLRNFPMLPNEGEVLPAVTWKYANSRIFLASPQDLCAWAVMPVAGAAEWYAGRRQAALRIGHPAGRARALRFANLSEQLNRANETRWVASAGPLTLDQPWQWVPAEDETGFIVKDWAGAGDLSAKLTAAMTASSTLKLVVEVRDDVWAPMDGGKGDAILIGKQVAFGLDSRYRPVIEPATPENLALLGNASVSHAGSNLLRYTIELPWNWRNAGACNATTTQFDLSFAIRDDDGLGVKGALEWARCVESAPIQFER